MKEYIVKPTREKGIYEVTDKATNEKVDYTTSELLDEVAFVLKEEKKKRETNASGYNELELQVCYDDDNKFAIAHNGNEPVPFKKINKSKNYLKELLKPLGNSPKVKTAGKFFISLLSLFFAFVLVFLGVISWIMQEVSADLEVTNWVDFYKQMLVLLKDHSDIIAKIFGICGWIFGVTVLVFALFSSFYNHKITILPLTVIKRKKKSVRTEEGIAGAFLFFSATTVALGELVKKLVATMTDPEKFSSTMPGLLLGLAIVFLGIIYNMNPLADFLRYISGFIKFEQRNTSENNENG